MEKEQQFEKLFVGGDLSGIQKFLYNITSSKAAVSLIGRSAYLRDYMKKVCDDMEKAIKSAGATYTKIIYCSGGKFYLLSDNSETIIQAIEDYARTIKKQLWDEHQGQLGIAISYIPFHEHPDGKVDVAGQPSQKPGILWKIVNNDFTRQKRQKFKEILEEQFDSFFCPVSVGEINNVCAVTGIESNNCVPVDDKDETVIYVLPSVKKQIQLGEQIRQENGFKTFEDYANKSYLGILRMDVDGLGKKFTEGFPSIAAYEKFSNRLTDFFENEVRNIQKKEEFKDYLNIIYAGGDDLFVVGRWDKTIDFAKRIHDETIKRFKDDNITISGGIAIVKPKYPIAKAAEKSGEAEHVAKQFNNGEKNAFTLLGQTISWDKEFDYVKQYKDDFVRLICANSAKALNKSLLHKIMLYATIAELNEEREKRGEQRDFRCVWHASYYLTRQMEKNKKDNLDAWEFCHKLRDVEIKWDKTRNLKLLALAARWAELLIREMQ